jgi:hypothetical protein
MRSHRLALTALLAVLTATAAGCGTGKDTSRYMGSGVVETPVAEEAAKPAPVVIGAPDDELIQERDTAKAAAAANLGAAAEAEKKRKQARRELREERQKAQRAAARAEEREAKLRKALRAAAKQREAEQAAAATPKPVSQAEQPITGSSVGTTTLVAERDRRSAAEARAAVVRMHELLNERDPRSCDLLTEKLLHAVYGAEDGALERCRAAVAATTFPVAVVVSESRAHGRSASVAAISKLGDSSYEQTFTLVLVQGTWLVDAIERAPAAS